MVVDASVAFKWFVPEQGSTAALAILERNEDLVGPDLVLVEVVNAMWARLRGRDRFEQVVSDAARALPRMIDATQASGDLVPRALEMAIELNHPLYDCIYLALAEQTEAQLATADLGFFRKLADSSYSALALAVQDVDA